MLFRSLGSMVGRLNIRRDMDPTWIAKLLDPGSGVLRRLRFENKLKAVAQAVLGDGIYAALWALLNRRGPETDDLENTPA